MKTKNQKEYNADHKLAKCIVCAIVIGLLMYHTLLTDIVAVVIWFFAVNPVQWAIEKIRHHRHKVDLL